MGESAAHAIMLPYAGVIVVVGTAMTVGWVMLDLPLGPGARVFVDVPSAAPAIP